MKRIICILQIIIFSLSGVFSGFIFANEGFSLRSLDLPQELKDENIIRNIIIDDITGNNLKDLIIYFKNNYRSY